VVVGNAETYLPIYLEPSAGAQEAEGRRPHRVCGREVDAPVVDPLGVWRLGRSAHREVPFEEVCFEWGGMVVGGWGGGEFGGFADCGWGSQWSWGGRGGRRTDAFYGRGFFVVGRRRV